MPLADSPVTPNKRLRRSPPQPSIPHSVDVALTGLCRDRDLPRPSPDALRALACVGEDAALAVLSKLAASASVRSLSGFIIHLTRCPPSPPPGNSMPAPVGDRLAVTSSSPGGRVHAEGMPGTGDRLAFASSSPVIHVPGTSDHLAIVSSSPGNRMPAARNAGASDHLVVGSLSPGSRAWAPGTPGSSDRLVAASLSPANCVLPPGRVGLSDPLFVDSSFPGTCARPVSPSVVNRMLPPRRVSRTEHLVALGELEFRKSFLMLSYIGKHMLEDFVSVEKIRSFKDLDMATFEREVWQVFGRYFIREADRRLGFDWHSNGTYVYYCHVDSGGATTFKGPFLQQSKTHLQRVLGDDMVMLVKFEGEISNKEVDVYGNIVKDGILVGLRRYRFFVYKNGGKERKKSPSSSSVRCYFVCTESHCAIDENRTCILFGKSISEARSLFMHVHKADMAKYMARFSLILSKTVKLDVDLDNVQITFISDTPCQVEDGRKVCNQNAIHTDGTGLISHDLAVLCPLNVFKGQLLVSSNNQVRSDGGGHQKGLVPFNLEKCPPLLIQCRIFFKGYAIKGTLLVDKKLPPRTIHVRKSMIKIEGNKDLQNSSSQDSFEIVTTSYHPKKSFLSKTLIALLHYGGVPKQYFLKLVSTALDEVQCCHVKKRAALQVSLRYSDIGGLLITRMILCGIPLDEPFLHYRLTFLMGEEKKNLRSGRVPVDHSFYLMGTADPTGILKPNEVCVILEHGQVSGDVLVYRNPGLHFGDIHRLTARYVEELGATIGDSKYGIFFPTSGPRSVADEMGGGDFDGDLYWVSKDSELLQHFHPEKPWVQRYAAAEVANLKRPSEYSDEGLEMELFQQFLNSRFKPNCTMGVAADSWHSYMDRLLTLDEECEDEKKCLKDKMLHLVDIYYDALDAPKTGKHVEVPGYLRPEKFPHYMEKPSSYQSTSVIGSIYDMVKMQSEALPSQGVWKLPCFNKETPPELLEKWKKYYTDYRQEMHKALRLGDEEAKVAAAEEVKQKYKQILYEAPEFEETRRPREVVLEEALTIYHVVYDHAQDTGRCSFAWEVAGHALCALYASLQEKSDVIPCSPSTLREILGDRR